MDYKSFTNNLKSLKSYHKSLEQVKLLLEVAEYDETGVKSVDFSRMPMSHNPHLAQLKRLSMTDKVDLLERQVKFLEIAIETTENILSTMPEDLQGMLIDIFVKGKTYREVGLKHGFSDNGFWHYLKRETERYL